MDKPSPPHWGEPRRYSTDDIDLPKNQRYELIISPGPNGDWYVATDHEGRRGMFSSVRLCTSGGAETNCPGLTNAIADAYRAMGGAPSYGKIVERSEADALRARIDELEKERAASVRWFSIDAAERAKRVEQIVDQLEAASEDLSSDDIAAAEALIEMARGPGATPTPYEVALSYVRAVQVNVHAPMTLEDVRLLNSKLARADADDQVNLLRRLAAVCIHRLGAILSAAENGDSR